MSFRRVTKQFAAMNIGQLVTLLTQLLTVPVLLHAYGTSLYGQWLALTAAVTYLSTLNYGLQTYAATEMTILYNRGAVQECRILQSAALRILLALMATVGVCALVVFAIPVGRLLHLTIPEFNAQLIVYFFALQVVGRTMIGFTGGMYMVIKRPDRGQNFGNAFSVLSLCLLLTLAMLREPFTILAGSQVALAALWSGVQILDVNRLAPELKLTVRYWRRGIAGSILKPSGQYMLLMGAGILKYQLPLLLMQALLGPVSVVVFSVTRTIYSMTRRVVTLVTNSIGPEITITVGEGNLQKLYRLYELSERLVLLLTVPLTLGTMFATPLLLKVWLHKGDLYAPGVATLLGVTIAVQGLMEHKSQFQYSTNRVREISYAQFAAYGSMLLISVPLMKLWGVIGFPAVWCVAELVLTLYALHLNQGIFDAVASIDKKPVYKACAFMAVAIAASIYPMLHLTEVSYVMQGLIAIASTVITGAISYWIFQVDDVRDYLWGKLRTRFPALARHS